MSARCVYAEECGRQAAPHLGFLQCCEECYQNLYEVERTNNDSSCNIRFAGVTYYTEGCNAVNVFVPASRPPLVTLKALRKM